MLLEPLTVCPAAQEIHRLIRREIAPHLPEFARCHSTAELRAHAVYQALEPAIRKVLETPDTGDFAPAQAPAKPRYRILAWNIERGIELDGQLEAFRSHQYLKSCDVLLLTEADVGMARSGNRAVAQTLARELGLDYAFVPCYLNLAKGAGVENDAPGENDLGLHGNAILSRYPICNVRPIHLKNGRDKMAGREKRLGGQTAIAAEIEFPNYRLTAASVHLDAQSTQRHRRDQMQDVLDAIGAQSPVILGGDWNTTTYNSSRAFAAILGFWLRVFLGVDNVIDNHYLHPYHRFEKELFALLEQRGFDYRNSNRIGEYTISYSVDDQRTRQNLGEWVPAFCFPFIRWSLRHHGGKCPLKIDWFAARGLRCENPAVIHDVREGRAVPLSDHDAIGVDVVVLARV
ncbi:MAG: endonuclease/exonuclease/phosphatase family protein [Acidobacteria bacterium]|nr:endonuclease/exonuclease/phosphatase family protein [Acidobacteriota bacterium]